MSAIEVAAPRGRRLAVVTAITGTVFIAAGAFWLSFTALADLARRSGIDAGQAWAWPLIVDGIIVVATVAVVALASQRRPTWYPWTLRPRPLLHRRRSPCENVNQCTPRGYRRCR